METITRSFRPKDGDWYTRDFVIMTKEEADEEGVEYVHWKEAKPGDWALSDDGLVGECFGEYKKMNRVKLAYAHPFRGRTTPLNAREFIDKRAWSRSGTPEAWDEREVRRRRTQRLIKAFIAFLIAGEKPDYQTLGNIYRSDEKNPEQTARKLLKNPTIRAEVDKQLADALIEQGLTQEETLKLLAEAKKEATDKEDRSVNEILKVYDRLAKLHGLEKKKRPTVTDFDYTEVVKGGDRARRLQGRVEGGE